MASSSILNNSSGSEADPSDPQHIVDIRKRKRMQSNRESARRSRQRKQKHLDDLTGQVTELKSQNNKILSTINSTTQLYIDMEAENSVLRAQLGELSNRLQSLNDIISCLSNNNNNNHDTRNMGMNKSTNEFDDQESYNNFDMELFDDGFSMNSWGFSFANYPIMPTLDAFMC